MENYYQLSIKLFEEKVDDEEKTKSGYNKMTIEEKATFNHNYKNFIQLRQKRDESEKDLAGYNLFSVDQKILFDKGLLDFKMTKFFVCKNEYAIECQYADKLRSRGEKTKNSKDYYKQSIYLR